MCVDDILLYILWSEDYSQTINVDVKMWEPEMQKQTRYHYPHIQNNNHNDNSDDDGNDHHHHNNNNNSNNNMIMCSTKLLHMQGNRGKIRQQTLV